MNAASIVVLGASLALSGVLAYGIWRFDRRADRLAVLEAERIVEAEARRASRENHPSTWGWQ